MPPFRVKTLNDTDIQVNLTFGIGEASGNVSYADMKLGPYHVPNQGMCPESYTLLCCMLSVQLVR